MLARLTLAAFLVGAPLSAASLGANLADAAEAREWPRVEGLLAQGDDPDAAQPDGMTALLWAAHHDHPPTVRALLSAGADPVLPNRYGVTALALACTNGNAEIVEALLDAGADPNTAMRGGETALMTASRTGKLQPVRLLLTRGADPNARERRRNQTALMWAAAEGHAEVVELLLEFGAKSTTLDSGFTPFLFAVREGRLEVVRTLLKAGADPNARIEPSENAPRGGPRPGTSALLLATQNAHFELASALLDAGADPNDDAPGYTALHAVPSVRNPGVGDNDPPPPGSGSMDSEEFVRKLVASGADVEARMTKQVNLGVTRLNKLGATPFFLAAQSADVELLRLLFELGADPFTVNEDNSTALMAAAGLGTRSPGEDAGTESEVLAAVDYLLCLGLDINAVNDNGETVMHAAAYKNLPAVVELLAERGADIEVWNRENKQGWTPLVIAAGHRFGNYKPSPVTVAAVRKVMAAAGVEPPETPYKRPGKNADY